jgi:hypothetical protein
VAHISERVSCLPSQSAEPVLRQVLLTLCLRLQGQALRDQEAKPLDSAHEGTRIFGNAVPWRVAGFCSDDDERELT